MARHLLVAASFIVSLGQSEHAYILDEDLINLSRSAVEVCASLNLEADPLTSFPDATFYVDEPDAALFVREGNDYCIAAFRGTTPNVADWYQNLDPFESFVYSPFNQRCRTRIGYERAYSSPDYRVDLEMDIRNCKMNCPECEVVLTGHSQGGAVATVAAIAMSDLDPTIVTFGQPGAIIDGCSAINVHKYFRFVNTVINARGNVDYDAVPYLNLNADHMGKLFLMGDDIHHVAYYSNGNGPSIFKFGWSIAAHGINRYIERLFNLEPTVGTDGWDIGFSCSVDEECVHPKRCVDSTCQAGFNHDPCSHDVDCISGRCEGWATWVTPGICEARLEGGEPCNEDSDCISGSCPWGFRRRCRS